MYFVVVRGASHRMREIPAYLYNSQSIVSEPVANRFGSELVVVNASASYPLAEQLAERLQSGMFGARVFNTREDADAYVVEETTY